MTTLLRTSSALNNFSVGIDENMYKLGEIVFFNDNGIIFKSDKGWLDTTHSVNNIFDMLVINGNTIKKQKETFDTKDNYIIPCTLNKFRSDYYTLYIHADNVNLTLCPNEIISDATFLQYKTVADGYKIQTETETIMIVDLNTTKHLEK